MAKANTRRLPRSVETHAADFSKIQSLQLIQLQEGDRFIKIREVETMTSRKKSQIYADPQFPRPIKLSVRESAWLLSSVLAWMQARVDSAKVRS
jgi:predicted DNA-binding transcriptional regulator AlpA